MNLKKSYLVYLLFITLVTLFPYFRSSWNEYKPFLTQNHPTEEKNQPTAEVPKTDTIPLAMIETVDSNVVRIITDNKIVQEVASGPYDGFSGYYEFYDYGCECTGVVYTTPDSTTTFIAIPSHCIPDTICNEIKIVSSLDTVVKPDKWRYIKSDSADVAFLIINKKMPTSGIRNLLYTNASDGNDVVLSISDFDEKGNPIFLKKYGVCTSDLFFLNDPKTSNLRVFGEGLRGGNSGSVILNSKGFIGLAIEIQKFDSRNVTYSPSYLFEELYKKGN